MEVKVLGIKKIDYISKRTNNPVHGTELHVSFQDNRVSGLAVDKIFVRDRVDIGSVKLGDSLNLLFDRYGQVDFVQIM